MTSDKHTTGTDRVAEVAENVHADWYVNIQGDEPLIEPETIQQAIIPIYDLKSDTNINVINLMAKISNPVDAINPTIPKVITNSCSKGVFLTRAPSPHPKGSINFDYYKQLGVYAFSAAALQFFKKAPRGRVECIEDIEVLRFIENGFYVHYVAVETKSIAVDTPNDLEKVRYLFGQLQ